VKECLFDKEEAHFISREKEDYISSTHFSAQGRDKREKKMLGAQNSLCAKFWAKTSQYCVRGEFAFNYFLCARLKENKLL